MTTVEKTILENQIAILETLQNIIAPLVATPKQCLDRSLTLNMVQQCNHDTRKLIAEAVLKEAIEK